MVGRWQSIRVLISSYNTLMVSWLGNTQMAAVTTANVPVFLLISIVFGVQSGLGILVSQYWGKKDMESISRAIGVAAMLGTGITLVLAVVVGEQMHIVNIGDSRIYMVEKRAVKQLTRDHTLVQNMIDRGELSVEEAEHHPKKHYITRAIGVGDTLDIDYQMYELKKESVVLLCTDGLSNYLKLEKLPELLKSCIRKGSLQELIDYANNRGGSDNITAVVLYRQ